MFVQLFVLFCNSKENFMPLIKIFIANKIFKWKLFTGFQQIFYEILFSLLFFVCTFFGNNEILLGINEFMYDSWAASLDWICLHNYLIDSIFVSWLFAITMSLMLTAVGWLFLKWMLGYRQYPYAQDYAFDVQLQIESDKNDDLEKIVPSDSTKRKHHKHR